MIQLKYELTSEYIELNKLLKLLGLCDTGGFANSVIEQGKVTYNNQTEFRKRKKLFKDDIIQYKNHIIQII